MPAPRQDHFNTKTVGTDPRHDKDVKVLGQRAAIESARAITPDMITMLREQFLPHGPVGDNSVPKTLDAMIAASTDKAQLVGRAEVINYLESLITPKDEKE